MFGERIGMGLWENGWSERDGALVMIDRGDFGTLMFWQNGGLMWFGTCLSSYTGAE